MNNKQKMYLGVFMIAVVILGIMYSMGTFSKSSLLAFDASGDVLLKDNIMGSNKLTIEGHTASLATNAADILTKADKSALQAADAKIATNAADILAKPALADITSAVDAAKVLSKSDRDDIKDFIRSKVVLFDSRNYNNAGSVMMGTLLGKAINGPDDGGIKDNNKVFGSQPLVPGPIRQPGIEVPII